MVTAEYRIAYSEVLEILKYISKEEFDKIPKDMIAMFKENEIEENDFKYNPQKTLEEQNVSEKAKIIIAILFRDYWATPEQREKIKRVQESERIKNVDTNDIFKNRKSQNNINSKNIELSNLPIEIKKENIFKRIINYIKNIFNNK